MAQELIYTSVPRGLEPGRTGFCTVAMTRGMSPQMVKLLEGLVAYTPVFEHYDPNSAYNPASIFHYPVSDGRNRYELLARVCACGLDYTKRSNKIGHFILLSEAERAHMASGPASLLYDPQLFIREWDGEPQFFASERPLDVQEVAPAKANAWEQATGDAGWAAWLADAYMTNPNKPCFVVFDPLRHTNLQALVAESLMLLPPKRRWAVTWNTYMTAMPAGIPSCNWRFCTASPAVMNAIGCVSGANILDLRQNLGSAGENTLQQCARTGSIPYSEQMARPAADGMDAPASPLQGEGSLAALMQKRLEEQQKEKQKEKKQANFRLKNWADSMPSGSPLGNRSMNGGYPNPSFPPSGNSGNPTNDGRMMGNSSYYVALGVIIAVLLLTIVGLTCYIFLIDKKEDRPIRVEQPRRVQTERGSNTDSKSKDISESEDIKPPPAPKPEETAPKPLSQAPKPEETAPKPEETAPKPLSQAPKPEETNLKPPSPAPGPKENNPKPSPKQQHPHPVSPSEVDSLKGKYSKLKQSLAKMEEMVDERIKKKKGERKDAFKERRLSYIDKIDKLKREVNALTDISQGNYHEQKKKIDEWEKRRVHIHTDLKTNK